MKSTFLLCCLCCFLMLNAQEKAVFKAGDDIEYFDGVNWVDSKIAQVGANDKYLVYLKGSTQTKWFPAEDINLLFKQEEKIIKTETYVVTLSKPLYKAGDIVRYSTGVKFIESEVIQVNSDNQYQIFLNETKTGTKWVNESEIQLVSSKKEN